MEHMTTQRNSGSPYSLPRRDIQDCLPRFRSQGPCGSFPHSPAARLPRKPERKVQGRCLPPEGWASATSPPPPLPDFLARGCSPAGPSACPLGVLTPPRVQQLLGLGRNPCFCGVSISGRLQEGREFPRGGPVGWFLGLPCTGMGATAAGGGRFQASRGLECRPPTASPSSTGP